MELSSIVAPTQADVLVSFFDLTGYQKMVLYKSEEELFQLLSEYYELAGRIVEAAGGHLVKFIGDAGLAVFPASHAARGIMALRTLKTEVDRLLQGERAGMRLLVKAHFGPVICGAVGTAKDKRFDVFGKTVNTAAVLESRGFALTPQAFRTLTPEQRKYFKKHTPAITYIGIDETH